MKIKTIHKFWFGFTLSILTGLHLVNLTGDILFEKKLLFDDLGNLELMGFAWLLISIIVFLLQIRVTWKLFKVVKYGVKSTWE